MEKLLDSVSSEVISFLKGELGQGVSPSCEYGDLKRRVNDFLPSEGLGEEGLLQAVKFYLQNSMKTYHPYFMNQLWAGFSQEGTLAEFVGAAAHTSMYTYEMASVATVVEQEMIQILGRLAGFSEAEGTFVPGGSYGNMMGLLLARHNKVPDIKENGMTQPLAFFCSEESHYSMLKAANILGIGQSHVIKVACDDRGRMKFSSLRDEISQVKDKGWLPFAVVATAGTTMRGCFDPIEELADVCDENQLWLHVDGALGGSLLFSEKERKHLQGLNRADSFSWNFHKMMGVPMHCSVLLCQRRGVLPKMSGLDDKETSYLFHSPEAIDLGPLSLQCGRKADVLKIWFAWIQEGLSGFAKRVDRMVELATYAEQKIVDTPELELLCARESVHVCFRYKIEENVDIFNRELREGLFSSGELAINYGIVDGHVALRIVPFNSILTEEHIDSILQMIVQRGRELENSKSKKS